MLPVQQRVFKLLKQPCNSHTHRPRTYDSSVPASWRCHDRKRSAEKRWLPYRTPAVQSTFANYAERTRGMARGGLVAAFSKLDPIKSCRQGEAFDCTI